MPEEELCDIVGLDPNPMPNRSACCALAPVSGTEGMAGVAGSDARSVAEEMFEDAMSVVAAAVKVDDDDCWEAAFCSIASKSCTTFFAPRPPLFFFATTFFAAGALVLPESDAEARSDVISSV